MAIASGRWAVILKQNADGKEEVSDIKLMEGGKKPDNLAANPEDYSLEEVDEGVIIGMVRGGPVNAVGGFGFPEGYDPGTRAGPGVTRNADAGVAKDTAPSAKADAAAKPAAKSTAKPRRAKRKAA